jgi:hypothetical protein
MQNLCARQSHWIQYCPVFLSDYGVDIIVRLAVAG